VVGVLVRVLLAVMAVAAGLRGGSRAGIGVSRGVFGVTELGGAAELVIVGGGAGCYGAPSA
jgi:hypothetical protein